MTPRPTARTWKRWALTNEERDDVNVLRWWQTRAEARVIGNSDLVRLRRVVRVTITESRRPGRGKGKA